jgi:hypothetical protein
MKKWTFAVLLAAVALLSWKPIVAEAAGGPQTLPLDRNSRPIPVLKFGPFGTATMVITYDGNSSVSASNDQGSGAGSSFGSADAVFNAGRIGTSIIRIYCNTDAHVAIETSRDRLPVATTRDTPVAAHLPAYVAIAASNDRFAVVQQNSAGTCWFTPLE